MVKAPNWTRDELILALDLYFRFDPRHISSTHPEVQGLSNLLNSLPIHQRSEKQETFRNANGVYMKLCNFLHFDPDYPGIGLSQVSKLDEQVWNDFSGNRELLRHTAEAIRANYATSTRGNVASQEDSFLEGHILTRLHKLRERNASLVKHKKAAVLNRTGKLACEACGFDFEAVYGDFGKGFAECHHIVPISQLRPGQKTKLADLVLVCANCHRVIHRSDPMLTAEQLGEIVQTQRR